ncbi:MAG: hypothetical protein EA339_10425 [Rhodobacteraceae bacterium]|nr:MAG: hypothetical protein EA339_10425 [Paracoccaceae bacterium]
MVAVLGTLALFYPYLAPRADDQAIVLVFSPFASPSAIFNEVSALDLPIRDIRWNGRLAELDLSLLSADERRGLTRNLAIPALQVASRPSALCIQ